MFRMIYGYTAFFWAHSPTAWKVLELSGFRRRPAGYHHHLLQLDACHKGHGEPKAQLAAPEIRDVHDMPRNVLHY